MNIKFKIFFLMFFAHFLFCSSSFLVNAQEINNQDMIEQDDSIANDLPADPEKEREIEEFFAEENKKAAERVETIRKSKEEQSSTDAPYLNSGNSTIPSELLDNLDNSTDGAVERTSQSEDLNLESYNLFSLHRSIEWLSIFVILQFLLIGVLFYIVLTRKNVRQ